MPVFWWATLDSIAPLIKRMVLHESLVLLSEVVLSAYPILIKKVDASVFLQTGVRMGTFTGLAGLCALLTGHSLAGGVSLASGLLNLVHVGTSYSAFDTLSAGNAMALFYTYPLWNLIGAAVAFGETIPTKTLPWMTVAFVGALLLAQPSRTNWTAWGVVAALLAALTETGIYLWFRQRADTAKDDEPWTGMFSMYGGSGVLWLGLSALVLLVMGGRLFRVSGGGLSTMLIFNTLVGFAGYALRFYMIPSISTALFSSLSFFGIIAAYLLGWAFMGEVPNVLQGVGAVAIIVANAMLLRNEKNRE